MKKIAICFMFLFCFLCISHRAYPIPDVPDEVIKSVVMLSNNSGTECASGFLTHDGYIVTNAHVTASLCEFGDCSNVLLRRATAIGELPTQAIVHQGIELLYEAPSFDFAILKFTGGQDTANGIFGSPATPEAGGSIFSLGFPLCGPLFLSEGIVTEKNDLHVYTSARASHGSSGSPFFDENYQLMGIVDEAESIVAALIGRLFGRKFNSRGFRGDVLVSILEEDDGQRDLRTIKLINDYHKSRILPETGISRLRAGFDFMNIVQRTKRELATSDHEPMNLMSLFFMGDEVTALVSLTPENPEDEFARELERMVFAYNLEVKGARGAMLKPINLNTFQNKLSTSGRQQEQVTLLMSLLEQYKEDQYPGMEISIAQYLLLILFLILPLGFFWAISLGYVYARAKGSMIRRFFVSLFTGVFFWPVSFIYFVVQSRVPK